MFVFDISFNQESYSSVRSALLERLIIVSGKGNKNIYACGRGQKHQMTSFYVKGSVQLSGEEISSFNRSYRTSDNHHHLQFVLGQ